MQVGSKNARSPHPAKSSKHRNGVSRRFPLDLPVAGSHITAVSDRGVKTLRSTDGPFPPVRPTPLLPNGDGRLKTVMLEGSVLVRAYSRYLNRAKGAKPCDLAGRALLRLLVVALLISASPSHAMMLAMEQPGHGPSHHHGMATQSTMDTQLLPLDGEAMPDLGHSQTDQPAFGLCEGLMCCVYDLEAVGQARPDWRLVRTICAMSLGLRPTSSLPGPDERPPRIV